MVWAAVERSYRITEETSGCEVVLRYAKSDIHKQADMVRTAASGDYNAIITSIIDPEVFDEPIALANEAGMVTMSIFDDDFSSPNLRLAHVGPRAGPAGDCDCYVTYRRCELADEPGHIFDGAKIFVPFICRLEL